MTFNKGIGCIPYNHKEIKRDLELYYEFYYSKAVVIEEYKCLPIGVSVRFTTGLHVESNMTKEYFSKHYTELLGVDCNNWQYITYL